MTFPTTPVIDNFNRPNENPLSQGGAWTTVAELEPMEIINGMAVATGLFSAAYRGSFTDAEVHYMIGSLSGFPTYLMATRYQDAGGASPIRDSRRRGYQLVFSATATHDYRLQRMDDGASSGNIIAPTAWPGGNLSVGDRIGMRSVGSLHEVWLKRGAGAWELIDSAVDATYPGPGAITIQGSDSGIDIDEYGGGEIGSTLQPARRATGAGRW